MEIKQETWSLLTFKEYEKDINPNPTYQRSEVWDLDQKQLLIDSILRKIDIPKIYLREIKNSKYIYEIIDGQQRMKAIWDFLNNRFPLSGKAEEIEIRGKLYEASEKLYEELEPSIKIERIHKYNLNVVIVSDAAEDEIADLFYRLNNGKPLNPAEVRNSMPGKMTVAIRELSKHPFFVKVSFNNKRFAYDQVCAQMMMLELNSGLADTGDGTLSKMYNDYKSSVPKKAVENLENTLAILDKTFPEKSRLLSRAQTINLYLVVSYLLRTTKITKKFQKSFLDWYLETEPGRQKNDEYNLYMKSSTNSRSSIEGRFKMLILDLYQQFEDIGIIEVDPKRSFDEKEKTQIFARDKGVCRNCSKKVTEHTWHADHIKPWIKGGRTELSNGQLLCIKCNLHKKDKLW